MNLYFNTSQSIFFRDPSLQGEAWRINESGLRVGLIVPDDPMPVSYNSALKPKSLVDRVTLGDGYEQITESGVRSQKRLFEVQWNAISDARAKALQRFFLGEGSNSIYYRRPSEWFWWLPPTPLRTTSSIPIRVICVENWACNAITWNSNNFSATFEESFAP